MPIVIGKEPGILKENINLTRIAIGKGNMLG